MANSKRRIITNNREIYEKFNLLHFSPEILLKNVKSFQVERILKNINRKGQVLDSEIVGDYIVIKRLNPIDFVIYMKKL
jgi:hypothetical protein